MQRLLIAAYLLLSLTFLGQAQVETFSCGVAVAYSRTSDSGCQMGCCQNSSCCKTNRTKEAAPLHNNSGSMVSLHWVEGSFSWSQPLRILPVPTGLAESTESVRYAPPILATSCVRLI